ncbi:hypothetical protein K435DRAFT_809876 [Dendrothele bispora CBS 962.96]|uniref:Uncharacterized protein n=1 Tax=Dendrothele bispora (strain CBS 962.96) TaxID=1314807 RepID=A0A4S8KWV3_DENBC|nr:hypothetical protein K435DRAFT_809876 [Dendrothele bispora CBS 962.96]
MATAGAILAIIIALRLFNLRNPWHDSILGKFERVSQGLYVVTNCVADLILIFRCYIVWEYRKRVLVISAIISIANNVTALVTWGLGMRDDLSIFGDIPIGQQFVADIYPLVFFIINLLFYFYRTVGLFSGFVMQHGKYGELNMLQKKYLAQNYRGLTAWSRGFFTLLLSWYGGLPWCILLQVAAIAPTMIIVRAGLGVNGDNIHATVLDHILKEGYPMHLNNIIKYEHHYFGLNASFWLEFFVPGSICMKEVAPVLKKLPLGNGKIHTRGFHAQSGKLLLSEMKAQNLKISLDSLFMICDLLGYTSKCLTVG